MVFKIRAFHTYFSCICNVSGCGRLAEEIPDRGPQFFSANRFFDITAVIVFFDQACEFLVGFGAEEDDGYFSAYFALLEGMDDLFAVKKGHDDVEDDEFGLVFGEDDFVGFYAASGYENLMPVFFEGFLGKCEN